MQEDVQLRHELKRLRYETKRILVQRDRRKEEYDKVILQEQLEDKDRRTAEQQQQVRRS
eukprot:COSAG01_NODE_1876_length_8997_cov_11.629355_11_plen_59_part_00